MCPPLRCLSDQFQFNKSIIFSNQRFVFPHTYTHQYSYTLRCADGMATNWNNTKANRNNADANNLMRVLNTRHTHSWYGGGVLQKQKMKNTSTVNHVNETVKQRSETSKRSNRIGQLFLLFSGLIRESHNNSTSASTYIYIQRGREKSCVCVH